MAKKNNKILIIDDDINLSNITAHQLTNMGFDTDIMNSGTEGIEHLREDLFDLVLLDLQMPDIHGLEVLKEIRKFNQDVAIVIITAYGTAESAVDACRKGADDFITKPFSKEQLLFTIEKTLRLKNLETDNKRLSKELSEKYVFGNIVTRNKNMIALLDVADRAAQSDASILVLGESGTGKELLAKAIHYNSPRSVFPFVAVNCPSIPESLIESELFGHEKGAFTGAIQAKRGKFEIADKGTIFLDEIGDLRLDLQSKLLRVLQEREIEHVGGTKSIQIDVRVIAASNQDLLEKAEAKEFRQDLYYRLNVIPLSLPALRARTDDIPLLAEYFIKKYSNRPLTLSSPFLKKLIDYDWPGNVRELENIIQRAVVLCPHDVLDENCAELNQGKRTQKDMHRSGVTLESIEKEAIEKALINNNWNQTKAAEQLGIPRHVLIYRMKKLGISSKPH